MLYIESDGAIKLTRGDTARLQVPVKIAETNEDYILLPTDVMRFTVKKSPYDAAPLFQKIVTGTNVFLIVPTDTKSLQFGKYQYDVELTKSPTEVYTVIVPTLFEILKEVS